MKKTITLPNSFFNAVNNLFRDENIEIDIIQSNNNSVCVLIIDDSEKPLETGGTISCPDARALAEKLEITPAQFGKLLNLLNIKVRHCELGLF